MRIVAIAAAPQSIDQGLEAALSLLLQRREILNLLVELALRSLLRRREILHLLGEFLIPAPLSAGILYP
jgi:hypothetical protein